VGHGRTLPAHTYIGAASAAFVELTFAEHGDKTLTVASCEGYPQPVFLTDRSEVEFYVRDGNSSKPLNVLESNKYIENRWQGTKAAA
jgi:hypothetical protein